MPTNDSYKDVNGGRSGSDRTSLSTTQRRSLAHRLLGDLDRWREIPAAGREARILSTTGDFLRRKRQKGA